MYQWSPELFQMMNQAFTRRSTVESLKQRQMMMIAAWNSNSSFEKSEEGLKARREMVEEYNRTIDEIIYSIYDSRTIEEIREAEQNDPFLQAMNLDYQISETQEQKQQQVESGERRLTGGM